MLVLTVGLKGGRAPSARRNGASKLKLIAEFPGRRVGFAAELLAHAATDFRRQVFGKLGHIEEWPDFDLALSRQLAQRFIRASASSKSLTSQSHKPATHSRLSAKGPSMTRLAGTVEPNTLALARRA